MPLIFLLWPFTFVFFFITPMSDLQRIEAVFYFTSCSLSQLCDEDYALLMQQVLPELVQCPWQNVLLTGVCTKCCVIKNFVGVSMQVNSTALISLQLKSSWLRLSSLYNSSSTTLKYSKINLTKKLWFLNVQISISTWLSTEIPDLPPSAVSSTKNEHPLRQVVLLQCWCFSLLLSEYKMSMQEKKTSQDHISNNRCLTSEQVFKKGPKDADRTRCTK